MRKTKEFKREHRYLVLKLKDVDPALSSLEKNILNLILNKVAEYRDFIGKPPLKSLVIEEDWPEYEKAWKAIEERMMKDD